jgi:hypothetical protein
LAPDSKLGRPRFWGKKVVSPKANFFASDNDILYIIPIDHYQMNSRVEKNGFRKKLYDSQGPML